MSDDKKPITAELDENYTEATTTLPQLRPYHAVLPNGTSVHVGPATSMMLAVANADQTGEGIVFIMSCEYGQQPFGLSRLIGADEARMLAAGLIDLADKIGGGHRVH